MPAGTNTGNGAASALGMTTTQTRNTVLRQIGSNGGIAGLASSTGDYQGADIEDQAGLDPSTYSNELNTNATTVAQNSGSSLTSESAAMTTASTVAAQGARLQGL